MSRMLGRPLSSAARSSSGHSFISTSSVGSNGGSAAVSEDLRLNLIKMDELLCEMPNKLVALSTVPTDLQDLYQEVCHKVWKTVTKWQDTKLEGTENTRGRAAIRFCDAIYEAAMDFEVEQLSTRIKTLDDGQHVQDYWTVIDVCKCTQARIHQLYMHAKLKRGLVGHNCSCPQGMPRHAPLSAKTISYAKAAEGQIQCVEAYRQLHRSLLGEETWL